MIESVAEKGGITNAMEVIGRQKSVGDGIDTGDRKSAGVSSGVMWRAGYRSRRIEP